MAIPRSGDAAHIRENADVFGFALGGGDLAALDACDEGHPYYWHPDATRQIAAVDVGGGGGDANGDVANGHPAAKKQRTA